MVFRPQAGLMWNSVKVTKKNKTKKKKTKEKRKEREKKEEDIKNEQGDAKGDNVKYGYGCNKRIG